MEPTTIIDRLAHNADRAPDFLSNRFVEKGEVVSTYTYSQAWEWACRWAALMQDRGVRRGSVVVLALPNTADFIGAYYGVLLAGGVPAPAPPFRHIQADDPYVATVARRIEYTRARALVVPPEQDALGQLPILASMPHLSVVTRRDLPDSAPRLSSQASEDDIGLMQFTSGTSGNPKAVMLSHRALHEQTVAITNRLQIFDPKKDRGLSWLPLYHDMGIIGFLLTPGYCGGTMTFLLTEDFIRRPGLWIKGLSEFEATITGGPPSAFALCARRMKDSEVGKFNLSPVRIALVGAEMISPESLKPFLDKFRPAGFNPTSLMPTYGLAENGLAVTMTGLNQGLSWDTPDADIVRAAQAAAPEANGADIRPFVSLGTPMDGMEVAIVNPAGERVGERRVGEIIVHSPSLMSGYYHQPEATQEALRDGWLWTGDMGYLVDGRLYMIGRQKEILIVGGRNYLPEELEETAAHVPGVRADRVAAVAYADRERATEAVVLLAETSLTERAERDALRLNIRNAVVGAGLPLSQVVLLPPKSIPSTANGKLKRAECKLRFLAGEFVDNG